jgi:heme exporter protein CcmD
MGVLAEGAHWGSVVAAYAATAAILGALVWYSVMEARRARRDLERLDARMKDGGS